MGGTPSTPIPYDWTVDIGGGRGRLAGGPAASIARIDAQLGRLADVNDAWRSPEQADRNVAAWNAYQNGTGPKAPYALNRWQSIHCRGYAVDSDDWYNAHAAAIWRRNGWRQTARYNDSRDEPWHGEYDEGLDEYLGQPAGGNAVPFPVPTPEEVKENPMQYALILHKSTNKLIIADLFGGKLFDLGSDGDSGVRAYYAQMDYAPVSDAEWEAKFAGFTYVTW